MNLPFQGRNFLCSQFYLTNRNSDQMEELFAPSIDGVIELIEAQVDEVKLQRHRRLKVRVLTLIDMWPLDSPTD